MTVIKRLEEAIEIGEVLKVIYQGGSQPGTFREIAPVSVKDGKVRARCLKSNRVKLFVLNKIVIVDGETEINADEWRAETNLTPNYDSLESFWGKKRELLLGYDWHIEKDTDCLSLHNRFKNGKPKKGSDVSISYEEYTTDWFVDIDGTEHEEIQKKTRPWSVRAKAETTRTFGSLNKAAVVFMEWAQSLAPGK